MPEGIAAADGRRRIEAVLLDALTLSCGGGALEPLLSLCDFEVYDVTPPELVAERIGGAECVVCNKSRITAEVLGRCPNVRFICVLATGYDNVDVAAARRRGAVVSNVPSYSSDSVAQLVLAYVLDHFCRVRDYAEAVAGGGWVRSRTFTGGTLPTRELRGKVMGVVGYGAIGRRVAALAEAFGMEVLVHTRTPREPSGAVTFCGMGELLRRSDVVTLHCPLTPETEGMMDAAAFSQMKPGAVLVNTSRGGTVVEADLARALSDGTVAKAYLDVLAHEPMDEGCPLRGVEGCVITPHMAWTSEEAKARLIAAAAENVKAYIRGEPINVVGGGPAPASRRAGRSRPSGRRTTCRTPAPPRGSRSSTRRTASRAPSTRTRPPRRSR